MWLLRLLECRRRGIGVRGDAVALRPAQQQKQRQHQQADDKQAA